MNKYALIGALTLIGVVALIKGCHASEKMNIHELGWLELSKKEIKTKLKDPDSAQFSGVAISYKSGHAIVCGEVNARNSFGGYGGFQRFIAAGDMLAVLESEVADNGFDQLWVEMCGNDKP